MAKVWNTHTFMEAYKFQLTFQSLHVSSMNNNTERIFHNIQIRYNFQNTVICYTNMHINIIDYHYLKLSFPLTLFFQYVHKSKRSLVLKTCTATCTRVLCWRWWPNHFSNRGRKCFKMRQYFGSFQQRTHSIGYSDLISRFCCLQIYEIYIFRKNDKLLHLYYEDVGCYETFGDFYHQ